MTTLCDIINHGMQSKFIGHTVLNFVNILLAVMATCGNFLIIVSVLKCKKLRSQTPTVFIVSLAVSDFLVGFVVQPLYSVVIIDWSPETCQIHHYKLGIAFFTCSVSIGNAVCVCLDRMLRITKPFTYEQYVTKKRVVGLCIVIWCLGPCIGIMAITKETETIMAFGAAIEMMLAIILGIYCSAKIYKVGQEHITSISNNSIGDMKQKILMERKLASSLIAVLAAIIVCWLPFAIVNIFIRFYHQNIRLLFTIKLWTILCGYSKSTINIFIFGLTNREIKKAIKTFLSLEKTSRDAYAMEEISNTSYGTLKQGRNRVCK